MDRRVTAAISPDEIRSALREYFADRPGIEQVRHNRDENNTASAGFDDRSWRILAEQVGVVALAAPQRWGGMAVPIGHLVAAVEECGAALYPGPARAGIRLARALASVSPDSVSAQASALFQDVLRGAAVVGTAPRGAAEAVTCRDQEASGRLVGVSHGGAADVVLTEVTTGGGRALAALSLRGAAGVRRRPMRSVDLAVGVAELELSQVPAVLLAGSDDVAAREIQWLVDDVLLAAEQVGGAQGCLNRMVEYAGLRTQFGHPIGTYQAISHRCAQTAVTIVAARALVAAAARALDDEDPMARPLALLARADAADAYAEASSALIQVSGGIGFTWEHDAHLHFRRARATASSGGTPTQLRHRAVDAGCLDLLTTVRGSRRESLT